FQITIQPLILAADGTTAKPTLLEFDLEDSKIEKWIGVPPGTLGRPLFCQDDEQDPFPLHLSRPRREESSDIPPHHSSLPNFESIRAGDLEYRSIGTMTDLSRSTAPRIRAAVGSYDLCTGSTTTLYSLYYVPAQILQTPFLILTPYKWNQLGSLERFIPQMS